ncbi:MAG: valine--tRNA ligase [bacterium]|nr:valine--tRNA ligase [bacterium]
MPDEFPTRYDPSGEAEIYKRWEESGAFAPAANSRTGEHFSIVLPPPNVTGTLHAGHAVMLAIEDMMVRYHRMKGDRTLWVPGLDHAAIATQNVVEKKLKKENVQGRRTRHELGREEFLAEVAKFVETSKARIIEQTKAMGASLDWSRLAYTLDEQRSKAVRTMFVRMYEAGILYRGNRIVNWCPRCKSTLADDEVEYKEEKTPFYYFKYGPVVIGTARPETKFQDKTLVVHPEDERYAHLVGTTFAVPWIEDEPLTSNVIADPIIDREFGTGAMTITPAHSFEDFDLAQRHGLPIVTIIDEDGKLTLAAGSFAGRNAREARVDIVAKLQEKGLVDRIDEQYTHNLSVCYRCETPVEPLPKLQWFVDVNKKFRPSSSSRAKRSEVERSPGDPIGDFSARRGLGRNDEGEMVSLKDLALAAVGDGPDQVKIIPERFAKEYFHWMENLRDWCISRQIWFGHRLPVWYRRQPTAASRQPQADTDTYVGIEPPKGDGWEQDPDTLDTWFSSGMWTFSTLGWPEKTSDLKAFHPTSVLETGYDIIFFWIARMILMTEFALETIPFKTVYLHGLVRDSKGRKMSKSLGNVIDPLTMSEKYGADAVRLALFIGTSPGQDTKLDEQKIAGYAKFVTKLWNIARYVSMSGELRMESGELPTELGIADRWLLVRRGALVNTVTDCYEQHEYSKAAQLAYDFAWHEFADWYIEATKVEKKPHQERILIETLEVILKLLHPAMPFCTEALWHTLRGSADGERMLITQEWPKGLRDLPDAKELDAGDAFNFTKELVTAIRQIRNEDKIAPKTLIDVTLVPTEERERAWAADKEIRELLTYFGRIQNLQVATTSDGAPRATVRSTAIHVTTIS